MEVLKKVLAVVFGILLLVLVVFVARWVGDKIRERYFAPKVIVTTNAPESIVIDTQPTMIPKVATYSAIPKTGPAEIMYLMSGFGLLSGLASLKLSRTR